MKYSHSLPGRIQDIPYLGPDRGCATRWTDTVGIGLADLARTSSPVGTKPGSSSRTYNMLDGELHLPFLGKIRIIWVWSVTYASQALPSGTRDCYILSRGHDSLLMGHFCVLELDHSHSLPWDTSLAVGVHTAPCGPNQRHIEVA